jgi:hypothetical protein
VREFLSEFKLILLLFAAILAVPAVGLPLSIQHRNEDIAKCESQHGIYIGGGKASRATCVVGDNIREIDL